jgi:hypothetical protein
MPDSRISDSYTITYRSDLHLLIGRWLSDAPVAQLQADYEDLLAVAETHGVARWLLDVRRRDQLSPELGHWANYTFYPLASTKLAPQPLHIAVLCSPARLAVYAADTQQQAYLEYGLSAERPYHLHLFGDEGQAMHWLYS